MKIEYHDVRKTDDFSGYERCVICAHINPRYIDYTIDSGKKIHFVGDGEDMFQLTDESFAKVVAWMEAHE